jgi:putative ABC transport system permease protein
METAAKVCLVSQNLAKLLPADAVGRSLRVGELHCTVIGLFRERVATFGQSEISPLTVLVPFGLVRSYTGADYLRILYLQADSPQAVESVTDELRALLQSRHRRGAHYSVQNLAGLLDAAMQISRALTAVLILVGCIALLVSGVGIMNIMLVTVTQRTREIGLRKALGATRSDILYQFLTEAFLISGTGALVGISIPTAAKFVIGWLLSGDYNVQIPLPLASIAVSLIISCGTGILFGYWPASKASRLQPIESLRHE